MVDRPFRQRRDGEGFKIGQTLKLYERIQEQLNSRAEAGHRIRANLGNKVVEVTPTWQNENIQPGTLTGAIVAAIATTTDELVPVDILAETEIADVDRVEDGTRYAVNVDAPLKQQARFEGMMEAGTGFTSLFTDSFDIQEEEVISERTLRDTYQFEILVRDIEPEETKDIGFGLLDITSEE